MIICGGFPGLPVTVFFPDVQPKSHTNALLSATADLDEEDLEEMTLHAQFRRGASEKQEEIGYRPPTI